MTKPIDAALNAVATMGQDNQQPSRKQDKLTILNVINALAAQDAGFSAGRLKYIAALDRLTAPSNAGALTSAAIAILEEVEAEIEQRQTSGIDKYWRGLRRKADRLAAAIEAAK